MERVASGRESWGGLKQHLEADNGCDFMMIECPNKCKAWYMADGSLKISTMRRKDVNDHLRQSCYLRRYQCEFCGLEDTFEAITGNNHVLIQRVDEYDYCGHQAECPEAPVTCPYECGLKIPMKRKELESHFRQCPQEPVQCPFAEAGCKVNVCRNQLDDHMATSLQQHVMLLVVDRKKMKGELNEMKAKLNKAEMKLHETEARLTFCEAITCGNSKLPNKLKKSSDTVKLTMPNFSMYCRSGKVWYSPPFYYRKGYKMCLAVYANGVGAGEGTHVSLALVHLAGEYDDELKWPMKSCDVVHGVPTTTEACVLLLVCQPLKCRRVNGCKEIDCSDRFCGLDSEALHLVNDSLTFNVKRDKCYLKVNLD